MVDGGPAPFRGPGNAVSPLSTARSPLQQLPPVAPRASFSEEYAAATAASPEPKLHSQHWQDDGREHNIVDTLQYNVMLERCTHELNVIIRITRTLFILSIAALIAQAAGAGDALPMGIVVGTLVVPAGITWSACVVLRWIDPQRLDPSSVFALVTTLCCCSLAATPAIAEPEEDWEGAVLAVVMASLTLGAALFSIRPRHMFIAAASVVVVCSTTLDVGEDPRCVGGLAVAGLMAVFVCDSNRVMATAIVETAGAVERDAGVQYAQQLTQHMEQTRKTLVSFVAAEMSVPHNSLVLALRDLSRTRIGRSQVVPLATIQFAAESLTASLNDLSDLTRPVGLTAAAVLLDLDSFDVAAVVRDTMRALHPLATSKLVTLSLDMAATLPTQVRGDRMRLAQLLRHVITGALMGSGMQGSVVLSIQAPAAGEGLQFTCTAPLTLVSPQVRAAVFTDYVDASDFGRDSLLVQALRVAKVLTDAHEGVMMLDALEDDGFCCHIALPYQSAASDSSQRDCRSPPSTCSMSSCGGDELRSPQSVGSSLRSQ